MSGARCAASSGSARMRCAAPGWWARSAKTSSPPAMPISSDTQRTALIGQTPNPRAEFSALVAGEKFDRARALNLLDEKTRVVQVSSPEVINALADFYDSLNPTQQAEVREFMDKRRGWFGRG